MKLIVLGGVPGSGTSTTLRRLADDEPDSDVAADLLDPEDLSARVRRRVPRAVPYAAYRPVVHGWHAARVLARLLARLLAGLLAGLMTGRRTRSLVVHDPATRG